MKRIILIVLMLAVCRFASADCKGDILDVVKGINGNTQVNAQFYIGNNVDGWILEGAMDRRTFQPSKLKGLTKAQRLAKFEKYVDVRCDQIILNQYFKINGHPQIEANNAMSDNILSQISVFIDEVKAIERTKTETKIKVDSDGDNYYDQEWTLKTDGSRSISNITPEPITE